VKKTAYILFASLTDNNTTADCLSYRIAPAFFYSGLNCLYAGSEIYRQAGRNEVQQPVGNKAVAWQTRSHRTTASRRVDNESREA
jgi:hypothetical protein